MGEIIKLFDLLTKEQKKDFTQLSLDLSLLHNKSISDTMASMEKYGVKFKDGLKGVVWKRHTAKN